MAAEKNEKATDLIVAQKLKDAGIAFCPNGSSISEIKKALKSASKRGNGRNGYPEYVARVGDFHIISRMSFCLIPMFTRFIQRCHFPVLHSCSCLAQSQCVAPVSAMVIP